VTRGSLLRTDRFRDIWALNLGRYRNLSAQYEKHRPIELSIRADNERFLTHVGARDPVAGTMRATGPAGFLEYGPRMPLKAGAYRTRWIGVLQATPGSTVGFVDVSLDGVESHTRVPLIAHVQGATRVIAKLDFSIPSPAAAIEFRLWVNRDVPLTLERIELYSSFAIPPD
jgi:hypothetical protein